MSKSVDFCSQGSAPTLSSSFTICTDCSLLMNEAVTTVGILSSCIPVSSIVITDPNACLDSVVPDNLTGATTVYDDEAPV
jgi:hypothetical protein